MRLATADVYNVAVLMVLVSVGLAVSARSPFRTQRSKALSQIVDTLAVWVLVFALIFTIVYAWRLM
jgi:hypothetical protein